MTPINVLSHWSSMILPAVLIAALAVFLPLWLAKKLPENMAGLGANLLASSGVLLFVSVLYFTWFYLDQDVRMMGMMYEHFGEMLRHLTRLGMLSAILWGPILLAVLAMQPSKWRPEL
ncbi:hypothetical protein [Profundibacter sp.]|uniref:hypothetical protein n=1 Tax=Profundibacter sp. TaxID=3101071 RepID=UPI003D11A2A5